jgi:hypothetical protein
VADEAVCARQESAPLPVPTRNSIRAVTSLRLRVVEVANTQLGTLNGASTLVSVVQRDAVPLEPGQARRRRQRRSGGATFVVVMQRAHVWDCDDRASPAASSARRSRAASRAAGRSAGDAVVSERSVAARRVDAGAREFPPRVRTGSGSWLEARPARR